MNKDGNENNVELGKILNEIYELKFLNYFIIFHRLSRNINKKLIEELKEEKGLKEKKGGMREIKKEEELV